MSFAYLPNRWPLVISVLVLVIFGVSLHLALMTESFEPVRRLHASFMSAGRELACGSATSPTQQTNDTAARFAYVQYATDLDYLCNALINIDRLKRFETSHERVIIYPEEWNTHNSTAETDALTFAAETYPYLKLLPVPLVTTAQGDPTWRHSLTKLNVFQLERYSRVLFFDSDTLVLRNMDWLFDAPPARIAMPRAYWLQSDGTEKTEIRLGSHIMLVEPHMPTYQHIRRKTAENPEFDMELVNHLFGSTAMVLPHRHLALLSGEFRTDDHTPYLGEVEAGNWDPERELAESYLVHFSDWPLPKPWRPRTTGEWEQALPSCPDATVRANDEEQVASRCPDREVWVGLYAEYDVERERVCGFMH